MHEVSLAEEILRIVETSARDAQFSKVKILTLEIGDLAGVETEALEFALTHMAPETMLEGALIRQIPIPGSGFCEPCGLRVALDFVRSPCPRCGHQPLADIEGTELRIRDLEVN